MPHCVSSGSPRPSRRSPRRCLRRRTCCVSFTCGASARTARPVPSARRSEDCMTSTTGSANPLANQFLVAMPGLDDPNFSRSVTYICEHNEDGAMGIVVNRPIDMDLGEVFRQLDVSTGDREIARQPVYIGGPVLPDRGFIVHRPLGEWESSLQVTPNIAVTTSRDILNAIAHGY